MEFTNNKLEFNQKIYRDGTIDQFWAFYINYYVMCSWRSKLQNAW